MAVLSMWSTQISISHNVRPPDRMSMLRIAWDNCLARQDRAGTGVYAARLLEQFADRPDIQMDVLNGWRHLPRGGLASAALRVAGDVFWTQARLPTLLWKRGVDL